MIRMFGILASVLLMGMGIQIFWEVDIALVTGILVTAGVLTALQNNPAYAPGIRGLKRALIATLLVCVAVFLYAVAGWGVGSVFGISWADFKLAWGTHGGRSGIMSGRGTPEELQAVYFMMVWVLGGLLLSVNAIFNPARSRKIVVIMTAIFMVLLAALIISPKGVDLVGRLARNTAATSETARKVARADKVEKTIYDTNELRESAQAVAVERINDQIEALKRAAVCPRGTGFCPSPAQRNRLEELTHQLQVANTSDWRTKVRGDTGFTPVVPLVDGEVFQVRETVDKTRIADEHGYPLLSLDTSRGWKAYGLLADVWTTAPNGWLMALVVIGLIGWVVGWRFGGRGRRGSLVGTVIAFLAASTWFWLIPGEHVNPAWAGPEGLVGRTCESVLEQFRQNEGSQNAKRAGVEAGDTCLAPNEPLGMLLMAAWPEGTKPELQSLVNIRPIGRVDADDQLAPGKQFELTECGNVIDKTTGQCEVDSDTGLCRQRTCTVVYVVNHWRNRKMRQARHGGALHVLGFQDTRFQAQPQKPEVKTAAAAPGSEMVFDPVPIALKLAGAECESHSECESDLCSEGVCTETTD